MAPMPRRFKLKDYFSWFHRKLYSLLLLQAILTIVAVPFLVAWDLPMSRISIIGNILFTPVITLFILISSLIFLTELLHIPNGFLCSLLNVITKHWLQALSCSSPDWLITISMATLTTLIVITLIVPVSKTKTLIVLSIIVSVTGSKWHPKDPAIQATLLKPPSQNLLVATSQQPPRVLPV